MYFELFRTAFELVWTGLGQRFYVEKHIETIKLCFVCVLAFELLSNCLRTRRHHGKYVKHIGFTCISNCFELRSNCFRTAFELVWTGLGQRFYVEKHMETIELCFVCVLAFDLLSNCLRTLRHSGKYVKHIQNNRICSHTPFSLYNNKGVGVGGDL